MGMQALEEQLIKPKITTNFDRVKSMNIEELSELLNGIYADGWLDGTIDKNIENDYAEWLEREVIEDNGSQEV